MPLPLGGEPGGDVDPPAGLDVHVPALVGADAGALDVAADAQADAAALALGLLAVRREVVPAHQRLELGQGCREVTRVVLQRPPVLEHQAVVVGHLVGLDEVAGAHLGAVEAEVRRDRIHRPLHRVAPLGAPGAPVGRHENGVGVERPELDAVGARLVRPEQLGGRDDRHDDAVGRVGPVVVPELHVEGEEVALVVEADRDLLQLAALVRAGDEVLAAVLGPLDVAAQVACRPRHQHLLGPRVHDLDAEPAADVGGDALDLGERHPELGGDRGTHAGGGLGGGVQAQRALVEVPLREDALALHRGAGAALDRQVEGEPVGGGGQGGLEVADLLEQVGADVVGHVVVDERGAGAGVVDADDDGQLLVGDLDARDGVLGHVPVAGDDHDDGLADVVDLVLGQAVAGAGVGERGVGDEHRQRLGDPAGQVLPGVDGLDAVDLPRVVDVDVDDPRVGVRAAHEGGGEGVVAEVVEVAAVAGEQAGVLATLHLLAELARAHRPAPPSVGPRPAGNIDQLVDVPAGPARPAGSAPRGGSRRRDRRP